MYSINLDPLLINNEPPKKLITKFSRKVYSLNDNNILKVDSAVNSKYNIDRQTFLEVKKYKKIDKEDLIYFPKLLSYGIVQGRCWAVYEYVKILGKRCQIIPEDKLDTLYYLMHKYDIGDLLIEENVYSGFVNNWGLRKDTRDVVIYDFGL